MNERSRRTFQLNLFLKPMPLELVQNSRFLQTSWQQTRMNHKKYKDNKDGEMWFTGSQF